MTFFLSSRERRFAFGETEVELAPPEQGLGIDVAYGFCSSNFFPLGEDVRTRSTESQCSQAWYWELRLHTE
ncbi:MAG: hypothetical protein CMJ81_04110 [Planctomycetaceae bacterium]|nr:hypothetical protein [Planctomycetaceae bacterium]MBP62749.1 hypothetical protein [Planctomycetaceae bacterium]